MGILILINAIKNQLMSNKNWVTVRDKCPQINVQFKWHTFSKKIFFRTDGQTDERTDGRSDFIMPQILFGGIKSHNLSEHLAVKL